MARPPRIEFPGAVYHVSAWSEAGHMAFATDADRATFLDVLAQTMQRFDAQVLAFCLLPDHYHLLLYTRQANLSRLMRHLGGIYTQHHNRQRRHDGALFHGRFKAILVDRQAHLLDVCRYVELNPLRLGLAPTPELWPWSSFRAHAGLEAAPEWLDAVGLWSYVIGREAHTAADQRRAAERYAKLVAKEPALQLWPGRLRQQIFLGDEAFARGMLARAEAVAETAVQAAKGRRRKSDVSSEGFDWSKTLRTSASREQALYMAHTEAGQTMSSLAKHLGLSVSRVSRLISGYEQSLRGPSQA
ncbi:transposase [Paucibacter sp. B2R-40]|uniref:transposase n=1 Tax=Paucibacter sp. B2R-40 TaxID=2893554 RepID=UPI0021E3D5BB|nr:transposase [Paucibacter sp. B2R-40]MCV2357289.1 transposase [Paucibacter sp. B2R-40]